MASFSHRVGRKTVFWTDHALDRWWERCQANSLTGRREALALLDERLDASKMVHTIPPWGCVSKFHRALAIGFIYIDETSGFIVNKNASSDLVAVTYIEAQ